MCGYLCVRMQVFVLLPAEKGGLRSSDVSPSVCLSVCVSFDFQLNFTMVIYGPILIDQSESREDVCRHRLTNQSAGECVSQ